MHLCSADRYLTECSFSIWRKMALFQIVSDIHTERYPPYDARYPEQFPLILKGEAPFLVLAGDIGGLGKGTPLANYRHFLGDVAARFLRVFLVMGNHEAYGQSIESARARLAALCHEVNRASGWSDRVVFLDRQRYDLHLPAALGGEIITVLGCTLWSRITDEQRADIAYGLNDFRQIVGWSPETNNATHAEETAWLDGAITAVAQEAPQRRVMVVTHHAPLTHKTTHPRYETGPITSAFSTDLSGSLVRRPVRLWVFGHTHFSSQQVVNEVHVVSYQQGYHGEEKDTGFNPDVNCVVQVL